METLSAKILRLSAEFLTPPTLQNNREPWTDVLKATHHTCGRRSIETKFTALFRLVTSNRSYIVFHIFILQGLR
jgi:hypothetical protein